MVILALKNGLHSLLIKLQVGFIDFCFDLLVSRLWERSFESSSSYRPTDWLVILGSSRVGSCRGSGFYSRVSWLTLAVRKVPKSGFFGVKVLYSLLLVPLKCLLVSPHWSLCNFDACIQLLPGRSKRGVLGSMLSRTVWEMPRAETDGPGPPKRFKALERIWSISSLQAGEPMVDGARQDLLHAMSHEPHAVPECQQ